MTEFPLPVIAGKTERHDFLQFYFDYFNGLCNVDASVRRNMERNNKRTWRISSTVNRNNVAEN